MKFKVTNSTVKPVKLCPKTGKDLRKNIEKVGHAVQFRIGADEKTAQIKRLFQGQSTLVDNVDPGLLNLQRGNFVKIEAIKDIAAALREHALKGAETHGVRKRAAEAERDNARKARVVEMGKDTHDQKSGAEHEDAVNPDGDPNFLAQTSKRKARKVKAKEVIPDASAGREIN